jgi:hypothetical protein
MHGKRLSVATVLDADAMGSKGGGKVAGPVRGVEGVAKGYVEYIAQTNQCRKGNTKDPLYKHLRLLHTQVQINLASSIRCLPEQF